MLSAAGADPDQAEGVADALVWANVCGRPNQGVWRLPILSKRLRAGLFSCPCEIRIESRAPAVAVVDGGNGIGHYVGRRAVDVALERARAAGAAVVAVHDSNFLGTLGYYVDRIARNNMLGIAFTNSFPKVAPFGGTKPVIGTNPLAFSAPRRDGTTVLVDTSTSSSAGSDITKAAELGQTLPPGIAIDTDGRPITDPRKVGQGALLALGGGARGYSLGLMVEILAGVATGAGISHTVRSMYKDFEEPGNNGHFFVAVAIEALMPIDTFHDRMDFLVSALRDCGEVLVPGERRWKAREDTYAAGGVRLDDSTVEALTQLADDLGVKTPWQAEDDA